MRRGLIIGTLVTVGLIVACDDDAMGPATTGSISLRIIVGGGAAAPAAAPAVAARKTGTTALALSQTKGSAEQPAMSLGPASGVGRGTTAQARRAGRGVTAKGAETAQPAGSEVAAPQQTAPPRAPAAPSVLDSATLRVIGPTNRTLTGLAPGSTVTVPNLNPGAYTVVLEGYVSGEVDHFGIRSGVQVNAGHDTQTTLTFNSFRPVINPIASPTTDIPFVFDWAPVPNADGYIVELDNDPGFPSPVTATISQTAAVATVVQAGTYYVRARAVNNSYVTAGGGASDYQSTAVIEDVVSGPDVSNPAYLGFMGGQGARTVSQLNILPAGDEDWFSATVCYLDTLMLETFAVRLDNPSPLDTYLELWDPTGASLLAENDDIDFAGDNLDSYVELVIPADGDYLINVSGVGGTLGSYELVIDVLPGPNNNGSQCRTVATVTVSPPVDTLTAVGATRQFTAEARDANGDPIVGLPFTWFSSDESVAQVDANGMVTAVGAGTASITATASGGVSGTAQLTVQLPVRIAVTPAGASLGAVGATQSFSAQAFDAADNLVSGLTYAWNSLNPAVVTIHPSTGQATALIDGQAIIAAQTQGLTGYALVTVTVPSTPAVNIWSRMATGVGSSLFGIWGRSLSEIYAVGLGPTALYYDGISWNDMAHEGYGTPLDIWGPSSDDLFTVGADGEIWRYDGAGWAAMSSGVTQELDGIWGSSGSNVFAVGYGGTILHYDGISWNPMSGGGATWIHDVWGTSATDAYAVGNGGTILHYDGTSWSPMPSGTTQTLHGIWGSSSSDVYAVGANGTVLHWNGSDWTQMPTGSVAVLRDIWGTSTNDLYVVAIGGMMLHYDGVSWDQMPSGTGNDLMGIWGSGDSSYVAGFGGTVLTGLRGGSVTVTPATIDTLIGVGDVVQFTAVARDAGGGVIPRVSFTWSTNNAAVATVDNTGSVFAQGNGTATITATAAGGAAASAAFTSAAMTARLNMRFPFSLPASPMSIASDGAAYFVMDGGFTPSQINEYDLAGNFVGSVSVPLDARALLFDPVGRSFYAKEHGLSSLDWYKVDPLSGVTSVALSGIFSFTESSPGLAPDQSTIYEHQLGTVHLLDFSSGTLSGTLTGVTAGTNASGDGNAIATDGQWLYTWDQPTATVFVSDKAGRLVTSFVLPAGSGFNGYSLSYTNGMLWVASSSEWFGFLLSRE